MISVIITLLACSVAGSPAQLVPDAPPPDVALADAVPDALPLQDGGEALASAANAGAAATAVGPGPGMACSELDMPPRLQWEEFDGYCGETSLQMAALYYGAWVSEYAARAAGGGPQDGGQLLLPLEPSKPGVAGIGRNILMGADALKLNVTWFPSAQGAAQPAALLQWTKSYIAGGRPVIWGVFISDCNEDDPADCWDWYDHIIPATGYCAKGAALNGASPVQPDDAVKLVSLYDRRPAWRAAKTLPAAPVEPHTAKSCNYDTLSGGCLPLKTNYGVAVLGIQDAAGTSLPVRLAVSSWKEPNIAAGAKPGWLTATVTVHGLVAGAKYRLLRFNAASRVPTKGGPDAFLNAKADSQKDFVAKSATWTWRDTSKIKSNGVAYYRCVRLTA